jgi:hypothetical protein
MTGFFLKDIGEQFRNATAVVPDLAGFGGHRLVDRVLHLVVSGFHQGGIAARVVVRHIVLMPFQARGHGQQVPQGHAALAVVHIFTLLQRGALFILRRLTGNLAASC